MEKAYVGISREIDERESKADTTGRSFTGRIAGWSARHRWWVLGAAMAVLIMAVVIPGAFETKMYDGDGGEGDAAIGADLFDERFEEADTPPIEQLVFSNPSLDASDRSYRFIVEGLVERLRALPEVVSVESYYDTGEEGFLSDDGHVVLAQVVINNEGTDAEESIDAILDAVRTFAAQADGYEIAIAGEVSINKEMDRIAEEGFSRVFLMTMILGLGILLIAFRTVVAAVVPLVMAVGSIMTAGAVVAVLSQVYPFAEGFEEMILLLGMAVGIDYSLFIVSRFRAERKAGRPKLEAIAVASNTTGRAVFYAGVTVLLSLGGLALTNNPIFISYALGAMIVVLIALIASLTLLPAMLSALGDKVNRLRLPIIGRDRGNGNGGIWSAITDRVLARPALFATGTAALLIALALPAFAMNLGFNMGTAAIPDAVEGKRALELLDEHFTSGLAAPAYVVIDANDVTSPDVQASVAKLLDLVGGDTAFFAPFETMVNQAGDLLVVKVPLAGSVDDAVSESAVKHLRADIVPAAFSESDVDVYVTGATAGSLDFKDHMGTRAPYVFAFVLGLAFLLLLVMFRSVVIPVKAIVLNLLSAGAAYGVLVMVFQWGWGASLLGFEATGIVESWLPLFLFGILFGLSMDYHMLLISRIKEAFDQGSTNEEAVSTGIKVTAVQITSAAAIMVGVFGSFALMDMVMMKQFGIGLAVAVLVDATIIRSVLLPAAMKLLGDRNWYLPRWLEWLPKVGVGEDGREEAQPAREPAAGMLAYEPTLVPVPVREDE